MDKLINHGDIVGVIYPETIKRQNSFGFYTEDRDRRDKDFILECISASKDYRYFDKYGNEFSIDEILYL